MPTKARKPPERISAEEYLKLASKSGTPSKYRNVKQQVDGITFHSKAEAARYGELKIAQAAGECGFLRQVPFPLAGGIVYVADFVIWWKDGTVDVEDVKGVRTDAYKLKKKLMRERYHLDIVEVSR